jgi:hypothetical protein
VGAAATRNAVDTVLADFDDLEEPLEDLAANDLDTDTDAHDEFFRRLFD